MRKSMLLPMLFCWLPPMLLAQPSFITSLYPTQHALNVPADAELRVGLQAPLDPASLSDSSIYIYSDITGLHKWQATLDNGGKDLRLWPQHWWGVGDVAFNAGEMVTVTLTKRLRYADGQAFEGFTWHFTVAVRQNYGGTFKPIAIFGGGALGRFYVADFNGDRYPDFAAHDNFQDKLVVFINDGHGKLTSVFTYPGMGAGGTSQSCDFDHNGSIDIAAGLRVIQFNDGKANFTPREVLPPESQAYRIYDFNNDDILDMAGNVPYPNHGIRIALSSMGKAFADTQTVAAPFLPLFYSLGELYDLDNDGRRDVVASGHSVFDNSFLGFATIRMKDQTPLEVFQLENNLSISDTYANDINGDGFVDYAFIGARYPYESTYYITQLNDCTGRLQPGGVYIDRVIGSYFASGGDVDGDGDIDFFVTNTNRISTMPERYKSDFSIVINNGKGVFDWQAKQPLPYDYQAYGSLILVDLDLDGDLDVMHQGPLIFVVLANDSYGTAVKDLPTIPPTILKPRIRNFPNPFNASTIIHISTTHSFEHALLRIFDLSGRVVKQWGLQRLVSGDLTLTWDGRDENQKEVGSGVYLMQLQTGGESISTKIILLR